MKFSHPLARSAQLCVATAVDGTKQNVLTIVTTLRLDPESKKFKKDKVERLEEAAKEYISAHVLEAGSFLLMEKAKD